VVGGFVPPTGVALPVVVLGNEVVGAALGAGTQRGCLAGGFLELAGSFFRSLPRLGDAFLTSVFRHRRADGEENPSRVGTDPVGFRQRLYPAARREFLELREGCFVDEELRLVDVLSQNALGEEEVQVLDCGEDLHELGTRPVDELLEGLILVGRSEGSEGLEAPGDGDELAQESEGELVVAVHAPGAGEVLRLPGRVEEPDELLEELRVHRESRPRWVDGLASPRCVREEVVAEEAPGLLSDLALLGQILPPVVALPAVEGVDGSSFSFPSAQVVSPSEAVGDFDEVEGGRAVSTLDVVDEVEHSEKGMHPRLLGNLAIHLLVPVCFPPFPTPEGVGNRDVLQGVHELPCFLRRCVCHNCLRVGPCSGLMWCAQPLAVGLRYN